MQTHSHGRYFLPLSYEWSHYVICHDNLSIILRRWTAFMLPVSSMSLLPPFSLPIYLKYNKQLFKTEQMISWIFIPIKSRFFFLSMSIFEITMLPSGLLIIKAANITKRVGSFYSQEFSLEGKGTVWWILFLVYPQQLSLHIKRLDEPRRKLECLSLYEHVRNTKLVWLMDKTESKASDLRWIKALERKPGMQISLC